MKSLKYIVAIGLSCILFACKSYEPLPTVEKVDLERYAGLWYEQAHLPVSFQKGCSCTSAEYIPQDKFIRVVNTCTLKEKDNKVNVANGKAFIKDEESNAKLAVQFFWPFKGKYWIIALADDYSYALVGHPNREYLWILSREQEMNQKDYDYLISKAEELGFATSELILTVHDCD